jgi:hypothetical protein
LAADRIVERRPEVGTGQKGREGGAGRGRPHDQPAGRHRGRKLIRAGYAITVGFGNGQAQLLHTEENSIEVEEGWRSNLRAGSAPNGQLSLRTWGCGPLRDSDLVLDRACSKNDVENTEGARTLDPVTDVDVMGKSVVSSRDLDDSGCAEGSSTVGSSP